MLRGRGYRVDEFYKARGGAYWYTGGVNVPGIVVWVLGILAYHLANPGTLGAMFPAWQKLIPASLGVAGGSLPSFAVAFLLSLILGFTWRKK